MCDITRLREICRDYSETSDRVSKSLMFLKHELRSLRQQDVMLLKQLVSINEVISGIKLSRQQKSGSPSILRRSASFTPSTTLSYTLSLRRPPGDVARPERFMYRVQSAVDGMAGRHLVGTQSTFSRQKSCSPSNSLYSSPTIQSPVLVYGTSHKANSSVIEERIHSQGNTSRRYPDTGINRADIRNSDNEKQRFVPFLAEKISPNSSSVPISKSIHPVLKDSLVLRGSTTSIDTVQSQADSVYGSGSDLRTSIDSLHLTDNDPTFPLSSANDDPEVILV